MADKKISGLTAGTTIADTDYLVYVSDPLGTPATKKITGANAKTQFATDISGKVDKITGKGLSTEDYTTAEKSKLAGIEASANNYTHPATHSADIITDGTTNKAFTATEQTKLSGIEANANNYSHPATHSADIIVDGTTNKAYTATEKTKLAGIEAAADVTDATNVAAAGAEMTANRRSSFQVTPDDTHYPTEKLVKDSLDGKSDTGHNHTGTYAPVLGADDNYVTDAEKAALHAAGSDTSLGSGAVAQDHGTGTTDMIVNVCYGTSATPPTASDTTEGTIYLQYTA